jgi:proline iminopeptidase
MLMQIRGTRLYVDQRGAADAPPILFIHGGPGAGSYDFLAFQGERLARIALRYAATHPDEITKVVFENPGWDMVLASNTLCRAALTLLPGAELPPHTGPATKAMWDERVALLIQLGERRMEIYTGPSARDLQLPADTELADEFHERSGQFSEQITSSASFGDDVLQYVGQLTQPALLIKGEYDPATSPEEIQLFRSDVPDGTYYYAAGAGHFLHAEQPDLFARLVTDFLS